MYNFNICYNLNLNCTVHGDITNIKIKYFSANTTSKLQPLDQGIIQRFKMSYRKEVVRQFLSDIEEQTPTTIVSTL